MPCLLEHLAFTEQDDVRVSGLSRYKMYIFLSEYFLKYPPVEKLITTSTTKE